MTRNQCPCCKVPLIKRATARDENERYEYDSYQCPTCQIKFALNWHRLGEDRPSAAKAA